MRRDAHRLPVTAASEEATGAFDRAVLGYLKYRIDTPALVARAIELDPGFGLAHCLQGYLAMASFKLANVPVALAAAGRAHNLAATATPRERAHLAALDAWIGGDLDRSLAVWEDILREHPTDILAFRIAHFVAFWLGRPQAMRASVERILPKWDDELPGYGTLLSCRCFAAEECGDYAAAEPAGWEAISLDRADYWGVHALAHVMEMQGRHAEGISLVGHSSRHWPGGNNILHHLSWHRALFHLERREFDAVLDCYDRQFRDLAAPLTQAVPDLYIDVQNAASMLFRLERQGVDVGARWIELADKAEARIGDCLSAFTLPHWMMALAATGRDEVAARMLDGMRMFGGGEGTVARIVGQVALPVSEAALAHAKGAHDRVVDLMLPVVDEMHTLGGSHAQRDVLVQMAADSAAKAGRRDALQAFVRYAAQGRTPPDGRIGYLALAARAQ